jgi:hypothetical protein
MLQKNNVQEVQNEQKRRQKTEYNIKKEAWQASLLDVMNQFQIPFQEIGREMISVTFLAVRIF